MVSLAPILSWPPFKVLASKSWLSPLRIRFMAGSMCLSKISPSGVSCTRLVLRIKSVWLSFFSSTLMDWLTADWEMKSCLEASEKLSVDATW